jgi:hypothetical protein
MIPFAQGVGRIGELRLQRIRGRQFVVVFQQGRPQLVERGEITVEPGVGASEWSFAFPIRTKRCGAE